MENNSSNDIMNSKRYKTTYRGENLYIIVVTNEVGQPFEIFVTHASNGDHNVQYMLASWDCLTRFISLCLQNFSLDQTIKHLRKSTRQSNDLPGIILRILQNYQEVENVDEAKSTEVKSN